jgi:ABC-type glutathione transport system ATPase component
MTLEGRGRGEAGERARWLMDQVGLAGKEGRHPQELSGGEQQRVAIAVALANNPPLLLADEPTGELDSATANEVFAVLRRLNEETGVTVVIVTHDRAITQRVDRVVAMRDGRTSTEIVRRTQYSRGLGETIDEFAVVDRSGRLQIPREYLEALEISNRARVYLADDHVEVRSEIAGPEPMGADFDDGDGERA